MKKGRFKNINVLAIILFALLIVYVVSMILPFVWGILTSIKHYSDFRHNTVGFPDFSYWENSLIEGEDAWYCNYLIVWKKFGFTAKTTYFKGIFNVTKVSRTVDVTFGYTLINTILCVGISSFLATIVPCVTAYMVYNYRYKFSKILYGAVLLTMSLPLFGTATANITLLRQLGLYDEFIGMWLMNASFASLYFLVFHAAFASLSTAYAEAAEIDGASQFRILVSIALPLVSKMISTIFLLVFVAQWNDYNTPLLYLPTKPTIAYTVFWIVSRPGTVGGQVPKIIATLMILALPILIIFIIFKDKLMGDISMGGVKE